MRLDKASFTVFDVETTGLFPYSGDMICEIGAIRFEPGKKRVEKFHSLVDPKRPISRGAFMVNGITDRMVRGKPTIDKVLPDFLRFIDGSALVAYNAGFDLGFIEQALGEGAHILDKYYIIDALRLARRLFPDAGRYNLGSVAGHLGIDAEGEHRALADALMTWKVFAKELELLKKEGVKTVQDIERVQVRRRPAASTVKDYKLKLIEEAIRDEKKLSIVYRSSWSNALSRRTITPKRIQSGYDRSYIIAHCHLRGEERNFRIDCIVDASFEK